MVQHSSGSEPQNPPPSARCFFQTRATTYGRFGIHGPYTAPGSVRYEGGAKQGFNSRQSPMSAVSSVPGRGDYASSRRRNRLSSFAAFIFLVAIMFAGILAGPSGVSIGLGDAVSSIVSHVPALNAIIHISPDPYVDSIVWQIRMPRILSAALIG